MRLDILKEAVSIDGQFIEDLLPGYKTIKTSGRETLTASIETSTIGHNHGEVFRYSRYPARTITVEFVLSGSSLSDLRSKLNRLNAMLTAEEHVFIFNDEEDKYFKGIPTLQNEVKDYKDACGGKISILCYDPFKYSLLEQKKKPNADSGATWLVDCNTYAPTKPSFDVSFTSDCGYVAFFDQNEHILQFGNMNETEEDTSTKTFETDFGKGYTGWSTNDGVGATDPHDGTFEVKDGYVHAKSYGSYTKGTKWHGITLAKNVDAADWELSFENLFAIGAGRLAETGRFYALVLDTNDTSKRVPDHIIAGIQIVKLNAGINADVRFFVSGKQVNSRTIDANYDNKRYGPNDESIKRSTITKSGDKLYFDSTGIQASYNVSLGNAKRIEFWFLNYEGNLRVTYNGLMKARFINSQESWTALPTSFKKGDTLEVDTSKAMVKLNGLERPDLGALGNDWETFELVNGQNQIGIAKSDSGTVDATLRYREVFI